jgi:hypothetical protein
MFVCRDLRHLSALLAAKAAVSPEHKDDESIKMERQPSICLERPGQTKKPSARTADILVENRTHNLPDKSRS